MALSRKVIHDIESLDEFKLTNLFIKFFEEKKLTLIKCYHDDRQENPAYECRCSGIKIMTCKTHLSRHLIDNKSKTHNLKPFKSDFYDGKQDKLVNCVQNYN